MKKILKKLDILLDNKQKRTMLLLVFFMLIGAALELLGVGLVYQAAGIITDPDILENSKTLAGVYGALHMEDMAEFTMFIMGALVAVFALKNAYLFFQNKLQFKFVYSNQFATSRRMMINFMQRPYEYYLNADTSVIQRSITSDVNNMYGLILNLLQLVSEMIVFVFLTVYCLTMDVVMTGTVAALLIVVLVIIKWILKPIMRKAGEENQDFYSGLYKWIDQSVMGIKEIKVANKESYFINEYCKCGAGYVNAVQRYNLYNATPRLLIETVAIAGMKIGRRRVGKECRSRWSACH